MGGLDERAQRILEIGRKHPEIRAESAEGTAGRIISARLRPGTDFLGGIRELTKRHNILAGALVVSFGSLAKAEISWKEGSKPDPSKKDERVKLEGPLSFLSSQGRVGIDEHGEAVVHVHGVLIDLDGRCWGAHFYEGDNPVYSTFEIVIQEIVGLRHTKVYDEECEVKQIKAVRL
jgi:hypothetical protein